MADQTKTVLKLDPLPRLPDKQGPDRSVAPACATFRSFLRRRGLKFTRERAAILDTVLRRETLFHADGVAEDLRQAGLSGSRATVYRTLGHLQEAGLIRQITFDGGRHGFFERVADPSGPREPGDYLIDAESGDVVRVDAPELREARDALCRRLGFEPIRHQFHVFARRREDA
ncbi:MAG: transcriptional repressor [Planctomycetota bacterium]